VRSRTLALAVLCALPLTAQTPAPSTLPEIGRVRAKGLCTTVRDRVAPMVLGLMKSDELVGAGHRAFFKMADDARSSRPRSSGEQSASLALQVDQLYLRKAADAMAHNLRVIDTLLADETRFPKVANSDDDRIAQQLKAQIAAVAAQQRKTLDLMNGALETEALGAMQNDFGGGSSVMSSTTADPVPKGAVTAPVRGPDASGSFIGAAGLNMPAGATGAIDPRAATSAKAGRTTVWDGLARVLETQQITIAAAEQKLSPTVVAISIACREELSSPAPQRRP
jgi:hypothetical protein